MRLRVHHILVELLIELLTRLGRHCASYRNRACASVSTLHPNQARKIHPNTNLALRSIPCPVRGLPLVRVQHQHRHQPLYRSVGRPCVHRLAATCWLWKYWIVLRYLLRPPLIGCETESAHGRRQHRQSSRAAWT